MKEIKQEQNEVKKQSFMHGVFILMVSQVLIKLLGFVYRWYMTNKPGFGDDGNGLYGAGFQIYTLLLAIASTGVPNAISKLVSERIALGDNKGAHKIFKVAMALFGVIGFVCSAILFFGANYIANVVMQNSRVEYVLMAIAPSVFFVSLSAVVRGYFSGFQNMKATANSQTLEQIFKTVLTITIIYLLTGKDLVIMSAGATIATTLSTILSFMYLLVYYKMNKKHIIEGIKKSINAPKRDNLKIIKSILLLSIPISISSIISAINRNVDSITVMRCLQKIGYSEELANNLYGMLSGKIDNLINLPLSFNIAFAISLVPAIASAISKGDRNTASRRISFSLLSTMIIGLPCTFGLVVLAKPILLLLFPNAAEGAGLLQVSALVIIFTVLAQTVNGGLQGLGKVSIPAIALGCGATAKIIVNVILIQIPSINVYGAAIGSVVCHIISFTIGFSVLRNKIDLNLNFKKFLIKPVVATAMMCICALGSYNICLNFLSVKISAIIALFVSIIVYGLAIIVLKIFEKEEIYMIPYGTKIYRFLTKIKIYQ